MSYDEDLANRVREQLADAEAVTEKRMFGGLAFLLAGNIAVAASSHGGLMVRVGAEGEEAALAREHVELVHMRERAMTGWVRVAAVALESDAALAEWVSAGVAVARSLPPKG
jgi:TfoX/Sxy family transcriptional regulator of competence genes